MRRAFLSEIDIYAVFFIATKLLMTGSGAAISVCTKIFFMK